MTFSLGVGSTYTAPAANTWYGVNYFSAPGQVNAVAATTDVFRITGLTIIPGNEGPNAARSPFIMRHYQDELVTCKRYYRKIGGLVGSDVSHGGYGVASGGAGMTILLTPEMRAAPTVTEFGTFVKTNCNTYYFPSASVLGWQIAPITVGQMWMYGNPGGFALDARL